MRKLIALTVALFVAVPALAEEAAAAPDTGSSFWNFMSYVIPIIAVPILGVLSKMLMDWQAALAAKKNQGNLSFVETLKLHVQTALARIAQNTIDKDIKDIEAAATDGKVTKEELRKIGSQTMSQVKAEFKDQGLDIGKKLGQTWLESTLRNEVDKIKREVAILP